LFVTGIVSTARLINSEHNPAEVYWGLACGIISQLVAAYFA
jgi:hypothetical protein